MNTGNDLKIALRDAVNGSFIGCIDSREFYLVSQAVVEFLVATGLEDSECVELLSNCGGFDAETDEAIDRIIEEFK